jgi:hypothetical protein
MAENRSSLRRSATEAELLDQIMQLDAEHNERSPVPQQRRNLSRRILVVCLLVLVAVTSWNIMQIFRVPAAVSLVIEEESARLLIYLAAQAIDEYRDSTKTLPTSLDAIGVDQSAIEYEMIDSTYTLTAVVGPTTLTYRDGDELSRFRDAYTRKQKPLAH